MSRTQDLSNALLKSSFVQLRWTGGLVVIALSLGLITLFLVHQLSIWISLNPSSLSCRKDLGERVRDCMEHCR